MSRLQRKGCRTKVVFLTVHEDQDYVDAALAAGAFGYVTKSHLTSDLVPAIREALIGHTFVSKSINHSSDLARPVDRQQGAVLVCLNVS